MKPATLHLIVGLPCAGKTTYAKALEHSARALRLTPDEWHTQLFGQDFTLEFEHPEHNSRHALIESLFWNVAARALQLGTNVILDYGFWGRSERDDYRARATAIGATSKVHFLNVPEPELFARLAARNANLPTGAFAIPASKLLEWVHVFQPPTPDELE